MAANDWPKRFIFSPKHKALLRYIMAFLTVYVAIEFALYWEGGRLLSLVLALVVAVCGVWGYFTSRRWQQGPVVEAWPDCIGLPRRFWPALTEVRYGEITRLKKGSHLGLTVVYVKGGKTCSSLVPSQYLEGFDQLEQLLQTRTGLQVDTSRSWWIRLLSWDLEAFPLHGPGALRGYLLALPGYVFASMFAGLFVTFLFVWAASSVGRTLPLWETVVVGLVTYFATYIYLVIRRARKNRERASREKGADAPGHLR